MKSDYLIKAIDKENNFRIILARSTNLVSEACERHQTASTASAALGRVLTATAILGTELKGDKDTLTIRINGNGIAGTILASADAHGNARAMITNPKADVESLYPGKLNVGAIVGTDGYLKIIKDIGLKHSYEGKVALKSGEIAEDLAQYFLISEQIPSLISLGVLVAPDISIQAAGGLFIQALPGAGDDALAVIEKNALKIGPISDLINNYDKLEDILDLLMDNIDYQVLAEMNIAFNCKCNRERLGKILSSLTEEELMETYEEMGKLEIVCNFCSEVYLYELDELIKK